MNGSSKVAGTSTEIDTCSYIGDARGSLFTIYLPGILSNHCFNYNIPFRLISDLKTILLVLIKNEINILYDK